MFQIPFTQYLLPDGRTRPITWECTSHEQEVKAKALLEAKVRFESEMLQTGQVSFTVEITDNQGEEQTLAHEISANDESVIQAVEQLVNRAHDALIEGQDAN